MQPQPKDTFPPQHQNRQPGREAEMNPQPQYDNPAYKAGGKLTGKRALITGGDSGIGRAVAVAFAKEGADVAIVHLCENSDAKQTQEAVTALGRKCITICADLRREQAAVDAVNQACSDLGGLDILVNNAAVQYPQNSILDISQEQLLRTFESNFFSYFYVTKAALPKLTSQAAIINTASVTAFEGNPTLIDYSATKGAIVSPAPWPLGNPVSGECGGPDPFDAADCVQLLGQKRCRPWLYHPMQRAAQPYELAPIYVFLACEDSSTSAGRFFMSTAVIIN